jgi:ABC-type phosphate/phosphonate transport system substrate-binding protein
MWSKAVVILGLFGGLLTLASLKSPAAEEARCVRIGLVSSLFRDTSEALMQIIMRPFKSLLEAQTGMTGKLVSGGDAQHLGQRLKEGEIQLGIFHGVEFAWAKEKIPQLKPLLIAVNKQPFLRSHLIVRDDGKVNSINDLKGKVVALPALSREHCWLFLQRRCVPDGKTPEKFFSKVSRPRDAAYAIDDVLDGVAAAAIIDDADLEMYRQQSPDYFAKVKVLQQSEMFPSAVIAYYPGNLSTDLLEQFRTGMLAAKDSRQGRQMMQMCRITSFEEVPANFEQMLNDIAKAYPAPAK